MPTRRQFLKTSAALSAGLAAAQAGFAAWQDPDKKRAIGIQLYTLRNELAKDVEGTLRQVAEIGYRELEVFALQTHYFGMQAAAFASMVQGMGMRVVSGHVGTGAQSKAEIEATLKRYGLTAPPPPPPGQLAASLSENRQALIDAAAAIGQAYLVCNFLFPSEYAGQDAWKRTADLLNDSGEACKRAGIRFCYHNHDFEFKAMDGEGRSFYDYLLSACDPGVVDFELDLYWAVKGGRQPVDLFAQYPGRFRLWHVKDMDATPEGKFTEVGNGVIDFRAIFAKAKQSGMEHYFVEQDVCARPPLESIRISHTYVKSNLKA
ncbi:MAG: sugar phosphate isomerase/epimerase [Bacteroidia bacterium]|nr:sugar phosphate isomerase/epimerase [Bacteroidia bacterium]